MNTSHPAIEDFLRLTKYTCPHGWEATLFGEELVKLGAEMDLHGNFVLTVPGAPRILFTSHLDTASHEDKPRRIKRRTLPGGVLGARNSILGADDKAGMAIMLHMIRNEIPGTYAFFVGEERGCVGSSAYATTTQDIYEQVVSFDRYGTSSIITHQSFGRSASDDYAKALASRFEEVGVSGLVPDPHGTYTDSAQFMEIAHECTNISVGYYHQHTMNEVQDLHFLSLMADAVLKVPWEDLPIVRQPGEDDYGGALTVPWWEGGKSIQSRRRVGYLWDFQDDVASSGRGLRVLDIDTILDGDVYPTFDELRAFAHDDPDQAAVIIDALLYEREHVYGG